MIDNRLDTKILKNLKTEKKLENNINISNERYIIKYKIKIKVINKIWKKFKNQKTENNINIRKIILY